MTPPAGADERGKGPGEFEIIEQIFAPLAAKAPGAYGLKDDAALFQPSPGCETVLTVDAMISGVHFLPTDPPDSIAKKLLRVNLSDLAAKGAEARGYLLVTAWPPEIEMAWIRRFAEGLAADQAEFGVSLWGGDTVRTPGPMTLSLTAIGEVPEGEMIRRGGAKRGDDIYVTGTLGDAALGLKLLQGELEGLAEEHASFLATRYREPSPRLAFGRRLPGIAHAALDVSDGLMADLGHLCSASDTGTRIELEALPLSPAGRAAVALRPELTGLIAGGGDDYEILFAAAPGSAGRIGAVAAETGVQATRIGTILRAGEGVTAVDSEGRPVALKQLGYRHF
ncbi:thiamine-phosphate kinase [Parvibaculum sp.]|uniref:thiamine-phosphate kinase n=1 Tax=Parvibaculum sp. TaxID=2024848 RepID=UPI00391DCC4B